MGGLPKFRLEMTRHQERVAQSMQDALTALLNGRIAPNPAVQSSGDASRERTYPLQAKSRGSPQLSVGIIHRSNR
jgi:hypothetical protein